jgi:hypothetical protein
VHSFASEVTTAYGPGGQHDGRAGSRRYRRRRRRTGGNDGARRARAAKSLGRRYLARFARIRPCYSPPVADRLAGRLGIIRGAVRSASRATRTAVRARFSRLVRSVRGLTRLETLNVKTRTMTLSYRGRSTRRRFGAAHSCRKPLLRYGDDDTKRRVALSFARALPRVPLLLFFPLRFFFSYAKHSFQTQHCHESVSQDRMALTWRAHVVLAARASRVLRRTCPDASSRLPNINSTETSGGRWGTVSRRSLSLPAYLYTVAKYIFRRKGSQMSDVHRAQSI